MNIVKTIVTHYPAALVGVIQNVLILVAAVTGNISPEVMTASMAVVSSTTLMVHKAVTPNPRVLLDHKELEDLEEAYVTFEQLELDVEDEG